MSGGFSFPPPPPPPPKPTQPTPSQFGQGYQFNSGPQNSRGRGKGRVGEQGRGRGQQYGRGGISSQASHRHHGSYSNPNALSNTNSTVETSNYGRQSQGQSSAPGGYVDPNFPSQTHGESNGQNAGSPSRTLAGHKRKLDALRPPNEKIERPGPPAPPAIPSFGAPILPPKPTESAIGLLTNSRNPSSRSTGKGLGLTPSNHEVLATYSDSEDGEADEEAMYAELGDKLTFEHNGVMMSLKSQADLTGWKKERQKLWPTRARMAEKDEERRRIGEERKRLLRGASSLKQARKPKPKPQTSKQNDAATIADPDERVKKLSEMRKKVLESEAKNREAKALPDQPEAGLISLDNAYHTPHGQLDTIAPEADDILDPEADPGAEVDPVRAVLEGKSPDISSDSSSELASDDDAPEEIPSKMPEAQTVGEKKTLCKYFAASGHCKFGDACHFRHEQPSKTRNTQPHSQELQQVSRQQLQPRQPRVQSSVARKGIFERFKEQEQEEENRMALQVIKYLGKMGLFDDTHSVDENGDALVS